MKTPKRYHPALVVLHWLSALLIILALFIGLGVLGNLPNTPEKAPLLATHMTMGLTILTLTVIRLGCDSSLKNRLQRPWEIPCLIKSA